MERKIFLTLLKILHIATENVDVEEQELAMLPIILDAPKN